MIPASVCCKPKPPQPDPKPTEQSVKVWYVEVPCGCLEGRKVVDIIKAMVNQK